MYCDVNKILNEERDMNTEIGHILYSDHTSRVVTLLESRLVS